MYLDADKFMDWIIELMNSNETKPYTDEKISDSSWIRTFDPSVTESEEYIWHRDHKTRHVTVLEGEGWQFQFDDDIPKMINSIDKLVISKGVYHRLFIGKTRLKLKIEEVED
jgi:hypothetical protein